MTAAIRLLLVLILLASCSDGTRSGHSSAISEEMLLTHVEFAKSFAETLAASDYESAHTMLSPEMQQHYTVANLRENFEEMVEYGESPVRVDGTVGTLEDWPGRTPDDIGWVYVSVSGDEFGEAVTVIVSAIEGKMAISSIEWGRP